MEQTNKIPVWVVCDTCPCFQSNEDSDFCALDYDMVFLHNKKFDKEGHRISNASKCCELIEIRTKTETIRPEIFENLGE